MGISSVQIQEVSCLCKISKFWMKSSPHSGLREAPSSDSPFSQRSCVEAASSLLWLEEEKGQILDAWWKTQGNNVFQCSRAWLPQGSPSANTRWHAEGWRVSDRLENGSPAFLSWRLGRKHLILLSDSVILYRSLCRTVGSSATPSLKPKHA